jgi:hypothetical protein
VIPIACSLPPQPPAPSLVPDLNNNHDICKRKQQHPCCGLRKFRFFYVVRVLACHLKAVLVNRTSRLEDGWGGGEGLQRLHARRTESSSTKYPSTQGPTINLQTLSLLITSKFHFCPCHRYINVDCGYQTTPAKAPPLSKIIHVPPCTADLSLQARVKAFFLLYVDGGGTSSF